MRRHPGPFVQDLGFTHLLLFEGDILAWKAEKLPLIKWTPEDR